MDRELWGTFSVNDHLRRNALVADVLLYDRLVFPVPPDGDVEERRRWVDRGWRPARQKRLLGALGKERVVRVPWTEHHRERWEIRYSRAKTSGSRPPPVGRDALAAATRHDVESVVAARELLDHVERPVDALDTLAQQTTRDVLVDWSNPARDREIFAGVPAVPVDAVAAFVSHRSFSREHPVAPTEGEASLALFGWEFFVPEDTGQSHEDLIKKAVALASRDETRRHRRAFHDWRRDVALAGAPPEEALKDLEDVIADYRAAMTRVKFSTVSRYAFAVLGAGAGAAALAFPPMAVVGAFAGLGSFVAAERGPRRPASSLEAGAIFHDARRRFGWYRQRGVVRPARRTTSRGHRA